MESLDRIVETIAREMGVDEAEIALRKAYLEFDERDARVLKELHEALCAARPRFIDDFYEHFLRFDRTRRLLDEGARVARLKEKQAEYFDSLTAGDYGWGYVRDRLRVGVVHQRIGLEPTWYIGAYCKYLAGLFPEIWRAVGGDQEKALAACRALVKVVLFDISLALDSYIHADRQAITELKEYAESVLCSMPSGLMVLSEDLTVLSANRALDQLLDEDHAVLVGKPLEAALPVPGLRDRAVEVLATGVSQYGVVAALQTDHGEKLLQIGIASTRFPDAREATVREARLLLTIEDLTERERLRAATAESDARVRAIMDNVADGIITINEQGIIESFNRAAESIFGYNAAEVIGKNIKMLMPEPYRSEHDGYLERYLRTGESRCLGLGVREVVGLDKGGKVFPMELSTSEMLLSGQRVFIGIVRDITWRKKAETDMRKLSSAVEQTADSVIITNRNGVIEYVNPAFEQSTGYSREEAVGERPSIVKSGLHAPEFYERLWSTILKGEVFREVFINRRKEGSLFYEEKTITPLKDDQGQITHFVSTGKDITERMRTQERLHHLAYHDALTGLPNRILFMDRLNQALARARWHERVVAVLFLDLDRFKVINDTLGHQVGDSLLKVLAERVAECVREGDTVARFGGDEFAILLEDIDSVDDVPPVAKKVLQAFAEPFVMEGREFFLTTSIGISLFPADGEDPQTLLKHADVAMYRAKDRGRNNYQFYSADMSAKAVERLNLETRLRRALEREEFLLHYQPQVDLRSGEIVGVEALLRWRHPDMGMVPPLDFIPILEDTGLIVPVGEWVLGEACRQAKTWHANGFSGLRVGINLSAHQLRQKNFVKKVIRVLNTTGLEPESECLELEITESLLMENVEETAAKLQDLSDMGIRIAIDDFGTGYSSLAYLKRFPIDVLKIDRSFVHDIPSDPDDAAIATAIISLAHSLNMDVIAEGVETEAQLRFLREQGCDGIQGYLFSRPLPGDELVKLLGDAKPI